MENEFLKLDDLSHDIISLLVIRGKLRFNELLRSLQAKRRLSKPTLSIKLKELNEKKLIIREVEDVQKVSYRLNEEIFDFSKRDKEKINEIVEYYLEVQEDKSQRSLDVEINFILKNIIIAKLYELKISILLDKKPYNPNFTELPILNILFSKPYENQLLKKCFENNDIKYEVIKKIDEFIKNLERTLHD